MKSENSKNLNFAELLSPAGSAEGFYGAIAAGADAIYLAGNRFGARAYADNFTTEKLVECIHYAHLLGRKIYMTVNTLLKESEMKELYEYILPFYEAGLDAVIVQDLGVLRFVRTHFPGLEIHVSTQMTICDGYGAKLLKEMGASRIVPARELSLQEIISMKERADIEIETFIHGAMCYCYSGQCLFSSILGGRSGNRGRCAQPCRLPYTVKAGKVRMEECYPLSLKDMCTIEHIPELIEAGIDSFKIEGRMKKPEYTAGVTDVYRRCMDRYYELRTRLGVEEASVAYRVPKSDMKALRSLYIRSDIQDGYYYKHNGKEMVTLDSPAYSGSEESLLIKIQEQFLQEHRKLSVRMDSGFITGQSAWLSVSCDEWAVAVEGDVVQPAQKQPITEENVRKQLSKLGDSAFKAIEINTTVSEDAFYPLKQINEMRRQAIELLEQEILKRRGYATNTFHAVSEADMSGDEPQETLLQGNSVYGNFQQRPVQTKGYSISLRTGEQLSAFVEWLELQQKKDNGCATAIRRIYLDGDLVSDTRENMEDTIKRLSDNCEIWVTFPYIIRRSDENYLNKLYQMVQENKLLRGFLVRSMDGFGFLQEHENMSGKGENTIPCRTDAGVYVWNASALAEVAGLAEGFCLPYELKASEQRALVEKYPCEKIVYSRIPMMITANCVLRTTNRCEKSSQEKVILTDRYHKDFPVLRNCKHCYNIIYNSVPLSLHQECDKWRERVDLRIDFTLETKEEVNQVLNSFVSGEPLAIREYTTGHEKRGVE